MYQIGSIYKDSDLLVCMTQEEAAALLEDLYGVLMNPELPPLDQLGALYELLKPLAGTGCSLCGERHEKQSMSPRHCREAESEAR